MNTKQSSKKRQGNNEGEGNRTADHNYREGVRHHLETHDVAKEGREAAKALDDPKQAAELGAAERAGKHHAK